MDRPSRSDNLHRSVALARQCADARIKALQLRDVAADHRVAAMYQCSVARRLIQLVRHGHPPLPVRPPADRYLKRRALLDTA